MDGLVPKSAIATPREAVQMQSTSHVKAVVKNAMARYLGRYFDEHGENREWTRAIFPEMLRFVTDLDFVATPETEAENKTKFPIIKFYNEVRSTLPCIVISETGIAWRSSGIGYTQGAFRAADHTVYQIIHVMRTVNISLIAVTNDQASTDSIVDVLSLVFGELAGLASGMTITDDTAKAHWLIRFPKMMEPGSTERAQQNEDPKDLIWTSTTTIPIEYEDSFLVPYRETKANVPVPSPKMPRRHLEFPATVQVGRQSIGFARNMNVHEVLWSSDPTTLVLQAGEMPGQYYLIGRKPGTAKLIVSDGMQADQVSTALRENVVEERLVTITY